MGNNKSDYLSVLSEIIKKQSVILGPEIAILKARNVHEISLTNEGMVTDIEGDPHSALEKLVDVYVALSGEIVKTALDSVFNKYPSIKKI